MKIAGMTRISSYDIDKKKNADVMKYCIDELSKHCDDLYFLIIGDVDEDFLNWIQKNKFIAKTDRVYKGDGWIFDHYEAYDDLNRIIPLKYDWILCPDTDDALPPNIVDEIQKAEDSQSELIELPALESFNGFNNVIVDFGHDYPIGPHCKAFKQNKDISFVGSQGFGTPISSSGRALRTYHSPYPYRHIRYATKELIENRRSINYFQEYFLRHHETVEYNPNWKFSDYTNYVKP